MREVYQKRLRHSNEMDLKIEKAVLNESPDLLKIIKQKYHCVGKIEA